MTIVDRRYSVAEGTAFKAPVRAATTANITLSGEQTIDGVACVANDRVLVKNQSTGADNGIYSVSTGPWTRTRDFDGAYDIVKGTAVYVTDGSVNARFIYLVSTSNPITIGTTSLSFVADQSSAAIASAAAALASQTAAAASASSATASASAASSSASAAAVSAASLIYQAGFHNRIVNPNGKIAQQGVASTTDGAYTGIDQWYALTQSNAITPSQLSNVEDGTPDMMRLTQANVSAQRFGLAQAIETANCIDLRSKTIVLSARVRMSASTTLRYAIVEWNGTDDTPTKDIVNDWTSTTFTPNNFFINTTTTVVATGSTALTANTLATVSVSGTVSSTMHNLIVFFWTDSTQAQNVTLDIARAQLEVGSTATTFAPRAYGEELRLCQRYFTQFSSANNNIAGFATGSCYNTTVGFAFMALPVQMFAVPTLSVSSASHFALDFNGSAIGATIVVIQAADKQNVGLSITVAAGLTGGSAFYLRANTTTASRMNFIARL